MDAHTWPRLATWPAKRRTAARDIAVRPSQLFRPLVLALDSTARVRPTRAPSAQPRQGYTRLTEFGQEQTVESIATLILELKPVANERGAVPGVDTLDNPSKKRHLQMIVWRGTAVGSDADRLHNTIKIAVGNITRTASAMIETKSANIQSVSVIGAMICYRFM